jgi:integrase
MSRVAKGCVEQLPSGSWRARVYAGVDPITKREICLKATARTEQQAHIELGRLLKEASEGRTPESDVTVSKLLDEYALVAPWDVSTRQTNEGFIRRTIKPALGHIEVRKVRGPILDQLYARLKRCGDLSCTGRPFIEHRNIPALVIKLASAGARKEFTGYVTSGQRDLSAKAAPSRGGVAASTRARA